MKRLDFKASRAKFGRLAQLKTKADQNTSPETKYYCNLSFLHDSQRNEVWAKKIREMLNRREEL